MSDHRMWNFLHHTWTAVQVFNRDEVLLDGDDDFGRDAVTDAEGKSIARPLTDVLYHCSCGKLKTKTLVGRWTLNDAKGGVNGGPQLSQRRNG